jgi:ribose 5-phosphate isomerase B
MKIAVGCDHVGYELKGRILQHLKELGMEYHDFGTDSAERTDYPIFGEKVADAVASGAYDRGIVICGTGVGISIAANKVPGIRAVVCSEPYSALLSRQHNNSNILGLGARVVGGDLALMILDAWLKGEYEGGRHQRRLDLIAEIEKKHSGK